MKSSSSPKPSRRRKMPTLLRVLMETAKTEGEQLFIQTVGNKATRWQPLARIPGPLLKELQGLLPEKALVMMHLKSLSRRTSPHLPHLIEELERIVYLALAGTGFVGGVYAGSQLPRHNLTLTPKDSPKDSEAKNKKLTIHSAAHFISEASLEYLAALLQKANEEHVLKSSERLHLEGLKRVVDSLRKGISVGGDLQTYFQRRFPQSRNDVTFQLKVSRANFNILEKIFNGALETEATETTETKVSS